MKRTSKHRGVVERPQGSGVWWIRYSDELGREHREKIGLYQTAVHVYRKRKVEIREGRFIPEDIRRSTLMWPNSSRIVWRQRKRSAPIAPRSSALPGGRPLGTSGRAIHYRQ